MGRGKRGVEDTLGERLDELEIKEGGRERGGVMAHSGSGYAGKSRGEEKRGRERNCRDRRGKGKKKKGRTHPCTPAGHKEKKKENRDVTPSGSNARVQLEKGERREKKGRLLIRRCDGREGRYDQHGLRKRRSLATAS